eukprot:SAG22_NODE_14852_length_363_cov_0.780303_1_plen_25_part_10
MCELAKRAQQWSLDPSGWPEVPAEV